MKDIVDRIVEKKIDDGTKVIKLYSVVMLNYRQDLGDKAWKAINDIIKNPSVVTAFAFLLGYASAAGAKSEKYKHFLEQEDRNE